MLQADASRSVPHSPPSCLRRCSASSTSSPSLFQAPSTLAMLGATSTFLLDGFPSQKTSLLPFVLPDLASEPSSGPASSKMAFVAVLGIVSCSPLFGGL